MSDELLEAVTHVLVEAVTTYDKLARGGGVIVTEVDRDLERDVRQHFLDRWYRFTRFGIESRKDLEKISVAVVWHHNANVGCANVGPSACGHPGCYPRRDTTVVVAGTPLERFTPGPG